MNHKKITILSRQDTYPYIFYWNEYLFPSRNNDKSSFCENPHKHIILGGLKSHSEPAGPDWQFKHRKALGDCLSSNDRAEDTSTYIF